MPDDMKLSFPDGKEALLPDGLKPPFLVEREALHA